MLDMNEFAIFAHVAERLSFEAAAHELGLSASTISRKIAALELRLGVPLVQRTTRSVRLTVVGAEFAEHCRSMLNAAGRAEAMIAPHREGMQGLLSVNAPTLFGRLVLAPIISEFAIQHPAVRTRLALSNRRVDLSVEDFDIVFRTGRLPDSGLRVRRLGEAQLAVVANAACLARHGTPRTLADVARLPCLAFDRDGDTRWMCGTISEPMAVNAQFVSDDNEVLRDAAIAGRGFAFLPRFAVAAAIRDGRLQSVELDKPLGGAPVSIVFPGHKVANRCASALADLMVGAVARDPTWLSGE